MKTTRTIKNPGTYIENFNDNKGYIKEITVEHRSNNPKRDFLFVNKKQCKHIPCKPSDMIKMCETLARMVTYNLSMRENYKDLNILVIGFAETATAIGTIVGDKIDKASYILHTTREEVEGSKQVVTFEETHSHATTQKLLIPEGGDFNFNDYNYVLFVEDEISTGRTVINFINAFETQCNIDKNGHKIRNIQYGVASICNWQDKNMQNMFKLANIDVFALIKGELKDEHVKMFGDSNYVLRCGLVASKILANDQIKTSRYTQRNVRTFFKNRTGHEVHRIDNNEAIKEFIANVYDKYKQFNSVRVIGTEECMELPIRIAEYFENKGHEVVCHATTRSMIDIMDSYFDGEESGIKSRYEVTSAYDIDRNTYIYNIGERYDLVLLVTDSTNTRCIEQLHKELTGICNRHTEHIAVVTL